MYICQKCKQLSRPSEKMHRLVVEKRDRYYPCGTTGWEIIKEIRVCENCFKADQ